MKKLFLIFILLFIVPYSYAGDWNDRGTPQRIQSYTGSGFAYPRLDGSTETMQSISYEHHEIHAGSHYFKTADATVGSGATVGYLLATPPGAKEVHLTFNATGSAITTITLVEDMTGASLKGTKGTIFNSDRNSANTSGCTFYTTVTGDWSGTTIWKMASGSATNQSRAPSVNERRAELILESGVTYGFHFLSGTASNLTNLQMEWYEHTPKTQ